MTDVKDKILEESKEQEIETVAETELEEAPETDIEEAEENQQAIEEDHPGFVHGNDPKDIRQDGLWVKDDMRYLLDGIGYDLPQKSDLAPHDIPADSPYWDCFLYAKDEPRFIAKELENTLYKPLSKELRELDTYIQVVELDMTNWRDDLKPAHMTDKITPRIAKIMDILMDAQAIAAHTLDHANKVEESAFLFHKAKSDNELLVRTLELNAIRQELLSIPKEDRVKALQNIGKDYQQDLYILNAIRTSVSKPIPESALMLARRRAIEAHFPWIREVQRRARELSKWTESRLSMSAYRKIRSIVPNYLDINKVIASLGYGKIPEPVINIPTGGRMIHGKA